MKLTLKSFALAALALLASISPTISTKASASPYNNNAGKGGNEMKRPDNVNTARRDSRPAFIGGHAMVNIGGAGIPPHIYGQQYVRRGTHKRTNK